MSRSVVGMGWAGNVYVAAEVWRRARATWERLRSTLRDGQWIEVRYEDLVTDSDAELKRVCAFIGVPFSERMYDYAQMSTYDLPDASLAEQWRTKMTTAEVRLIEARIGELLVDAGYALSGEPRVEVGAMRRAWLRWHSRIGRLRHRVEQYGTWLVLQDMLARRIGVRGWRRRVQRRLDDITERQIK